MAFRKKSEQTGLFIFQVKKFNGNRKEEKIVVVTGHFFKHEKIFPSESTNISKAK